MPVLYSTDRIRTTHAGSLPRPDDLFRMVTAKARGREYDAAALEARLKSAVADVVSRQIACGLDSINDGELSKPNFIAYVQGRIAGYEMRPAGKDGNLILDVTTRDRMSFPGYFENKGPFPREPFPVGVCIDKLTYVGQDATSTDIANFRAALEGVSVDETFLPAVTPGTIEHWMRNEHYKTDEEFVFAIAEVMRQEYEAIVNAGFLLQIDDPDLPNGWAGLPDLDVPQYRKYAQMRIAALNHALRNIPPDKVRLHVCWGSFHGPHANDIPLSDIADLIFSVRAMSYSIEASNPRHEHEWRVFEEVKLPDGATLVPGVVGHYSDFIEHPDLIAERLIRYADLVGRENVLAGTDCGLGQRVGHPTVCWAKLEALAEGARRASDRLWRRSRSQA